ncbi:MAG: hypothetical protein R3B06_30735 [Kofleriaceae bacterium]
MTKYTLTLATVAEAGRTPDATAWTLTLRDQAAVLSHAVCAGDPHGDHARVDGRAAARKHAEAAGRRIVDADVRVVYHRPAPAPIAVASAAATQS